MEDQKNIGKAPYSFNIGAIMTGSLIGFLSAAVIYQRRFPTWLPDWFEMAFSGRPILFFCVFIVLCGFLGFVYSLREEDMDEKKLEQPRWSSIVSGCIYGILLAAVLYRRNFPTWLPGWIQNSFSGRPFLFFGLLILFCGTAGYIYTIPDKAKEDSL